MQLILLIVLIFFGQTAQASVSSDYEIMNEQEAKKVAMFIYEIYPNSPIQPDLLKIFFEHNETSEWGKEDSNANGATRINGKITYTIERLSRTPILVDAFAFLVCHEVGHLLGGAPLLENGMSAEGQADYFAATDCMPQYFKKKSELKLSQKTNFSAELFGAASEDICKNESSPSECAQILSSGYQFLQLIKGKRIPQGWDYFEDKIIDISFYPDKFYPSYTVWVRNETDLTHPQAQCRLETIIAGGLGNERPACWYIP